MRSTEDLIRVLVSTVRTIELDLEQLEAHPRFRTILESYQASEQGCSADAQAPLNAAIEEFVLDYVRSDQFPYRMPCTTGPGRSHMTLLEIESNASNSNPAN